MTIDQKQKLERLYEQLSTEIAQLYAQFMDQYVQIGRNGIYTDKVGYPKTETEMLSDKGAYTLLVHAQFENFVEKVAQEIFSVSQNWETNKEINIPILLLIIGSSAKKAVNDTFISLIKYKLIAENSPLSMSKEDFESSFKNFLVTLENDFKTIINKNNGIKEKDLGELLLTNLYQIEGREKSHLEKFVDARGDYAHRSTNAIQTIIAPAKIQEHVSECLTFFKNMIDQIILKL